jgi:hypothetical protein
VVLITDGYPDYENDAPVSSQKLDEIAAAGGTGQARIGGATELSSTLATIMDEILAGTR